MFPARIYDKYVFKKSTTYFVSIVVGAFFLLVMVDSVTNLGNMTSGEFPLSEKVKGLLAYYSIFVFRYLDAFFPVVLLAVVIATFSMMWARNEIIALMAMGISPARFSAPLIVSGIVFSLLFTAFRELYIPTQLERMTLRAKDFMSGVGEFDVYRILDDDVQLTLDGDKLLLLEGVLFRPKITLPQDLNQYGVVITAESALYRPAENGRSAGWLLRGVSSPAEILKSSSLAKAGEERIIVYTPVDDPNLESDQLFVTTNITPRHMIAGANWYRFESLPELFAAFDDPAHSNHVYDLANSIYTRILRPFSDLLPIFIGIAFFSLGIFKGRTSPKEITGSFFYATLVTILYVATAQYLAPAVAETYRSAAIAVWGPLVIFLPITVNLYGEVFRKR